MEEEEEEEEEDMELKSGSRPTKRARKMVASEPELESGEDQEVDSENEPVLWNKNVSMVSGLATLLTMSQNRHAMKLIPENCSGSPTMVIT